MDFLLKKRLQLREEPASRTPVMFQQWRQLLFLHWEWEAAEIQKTLPEGLVVDTFEGKAYIGLIPFFMRGVRPRFGFCVPGMSNFMETNMRTYVHDQNGNTGVWFFSLDCNQFLAVRLARISFALPYYHAWMRAETWPSPAGDVHRYFLRRTGESLESRFFYRRRGDGVQAEPGSLSFFLIERYLLFSFSRLFGLRSGRVHHCPYELSPVELIGLKTTMFSWNDFSEPEAAPVHAVFSSGVDVKIYSPETQK